MNSLDIFKEPSNKTLLFLLKILSLYSVTGAIFKEHLKMKDDMLMKTLVLSMKEDGKINCLHNKENKKIIKDCMKANILKAKNKEKGNLHGMMDLLIKAPFKKALSQEKVFFWIKNKITLMKASSKMDKNMEKESKKQELKNIKVINFINQGNLCLD